jgi:hypothetical protein
MSQETYCCKRCGPKPISEFYIRILSTGRVNYTCKYCAKVRGKEWQRANPEWKKQWKQKNKGKYRTRDLERDKKVRQQIRLTVLRHYSGSDVPFCDCCGDSHLEFLALDHKDGGGNKHRKETGHNNGISMYRWAIKNDYPLLFRVLCHNCNVAFGLYGYCPHQKERENQCDPSCSPPCSELSPQRACLQATQSQSST